MPDSAVGSRTSLDLLQGVRSRLQQASRGDIAAIWSDLQEVEVLEQLSAEWGDALRAEFTVIESIPGCAQRTRTLVRSVERLVEENRSRQIRAQMAQLEQQISVVTSLSAELDVPPAVVPAPCLAQLHVPSGYRVNARGVFRVRPTEEGEISETVIAPAPIFLSRRSHDVLTGESKREVVWHGASGWCSRVVDRRTIMDARKIIELTDFDAPINSNVTSAVVAYLADFEAENAHRLPATLSSSRMGWLPDGSFLLHDRHYTQDENVGYALTPPPGHEKAASGWCASGEWEKWQEAVELVKDYPYMMVSIYASCAAPLLEVLGVQGFVLDFSGETSGGKTTALRLAASVWGKAADTYPTAIYGWDATKVWIERTAGFLHNLPLILDETKRAKHPSVVRDVIYDFVQGQGRGRGSVDGTRQTHSWRSILISSGEGAATSFSQDAGTRARVISLRGKPLGNDAVVGGQISEDVQTILARHHGHLGRMVVEYLVSNQQNYETFIEVFRKTRDHYAKSAGNAVARRQSSHMAVLEVAASIAHSLGLPRPDVDPFMCLIESAERAGRDADRPLAAMQDVVSWCAVNQTKFWGRHNKRSDNTTVAPHNGWAGAWPGSTNWSEVGLTSTELRRILRTHEYDFSEIVDRWVERKWLRVGGSRTTRPLRIDGMQVRCYCLRRDVVEMLIED